MSGGGKTVTVGYRYFMGLHMGLCAGPIDMLREIRAGDRTAWTGSVTASGLITINSPDLFGGEEKEGGIAGDLEIMMGEATQGVSTYLLSKQGSPQPAYRGLLGLVFRQGLISANNPYIKPWAVRARRVLKGWQGDSPWYSAKAAITLPGGVGVAMNPAHIVYECLTNYEWGMGQGTSLIDDTSFRAAADTFYAEGMGLCLQWLRQQPIEQFVQIIMDHVGATLGQDRRTGLFVLKPIRGGYDPSTLPVFNESNILTLDSYQRPAIPEAVNEITVQFDDLATGKQSSVTVQNLANIQSQGGIVSQGRNYPGFAVASLAMRAAMRDLRTVSTPLAKVRMQVNRAGYNLLPGDLIKLNWSKLGITGLVLRVLRVSAGTVTSGAVQLDCAEDVFGLPTTTYSTQQSSGWTEPTNDPEPMLRRVVEEATYFELQRNLTSTELVALQPDAGYLSVTGERSTSDSIDFEIRTRPNAGNYATGGRGTFCPTARLAAAIGAGTTSVGFDNLLDVAGVQAGTYALIENEAVRLDTFNTTTGVATIGRGALDTCARPHAEGTPVYFVDGFLASDFVERVDAEVVQVKLLPRTGLGAITEAEAAVDTVTFDQRAFRPYPPGRLRLNSVAWPTTLIDDSLTVSWSHRSRLQQNLEGDESGNIGPEAGTTYSARLIRRTDDAVIKSATGMTGTSWSAGVVSSGDYAVEVWSVRSGLESRQRQRHEFSLIGSNVAAWGKLWGANWGLKQALPRIAEFSLGGVFQAGAVLRVTLDGVQFVYNEKAADTNLAGVATQLAALIDADSNYTATASGSVVTVTGPLRLNYSIAVSVTPSGGGSLVSYLSQSGAAQTAGNRQVLFYRFRGTPTDGSFAPSPLPMRFYMTAQRRAETFGQSSLYYGVGSCLIRASDYNPLFLINDVIGGGTAVSPTDGISLPQALLNAGMPSGDVYFIRRNFGPPYPADIAEDFLSAGTTGFDHALVFPRGEEVIVSQPGYTVPFVPGSWVVDRFSIEGYPLAATAGFSFRLGANFQPKVAADRPQITRHAIYGTRIVGSTYTITLNSVDYNYTAQAGDTNTQIANALATQIDQTSDFIASVEGGTDTIGTTVLVLNFNGTTEDAAGIHSPQVFGDASIVSGPSYVGGGAIATTLGYVRVDQDNGSLNMGADDWTFEAVFTQSAMTQPYSADVITFGSAASDRLSAAVAIYVENLTVKARVTLGRPSGMGYVHIMVGPTITAGQRIHAAVQRSGDTVQFLVSVNNATGQLRDSFVADEAGLVWGLDNLRSRPMTINGGPDAGTTNPSTTNRFIGTTDSVRVTRGAARYSNGYTPPSADFVLNPTVVVTRSVPIVSYTYSSRVTAPTTSLSYTVTQQAQ